MPFLREKNGAWSPEKIGALAIALVPIVWLAGRTLTGDLDLARPVTDAIHFTGRWAVRLLLLSLLVTPARGLLSWNRLIGARRILGVAAACYAAFHFTLYVADQKFDLAKVASEIVLRVYLTIGFVALAALIALAVTSTDAAIRRLGRRWGVLHRAVYLAALLAVVHFMMQKKLDITEPVLMAGLLLWLFGYRLLRRFGVPARIPALLALSAAAAGLTALAEAFWYRGMTGVPAGRVLESNLMFDIVIRPMWWVLAAGVAATLGTLAWQRLYPREPRRRTLSAAE
ncbi:MAG: sulfoxide reductase heme-binding subunit YedZ [Rhizobiales bacterium]|nr:sulfoxide reductase heme-binding subunit YedZ [Hyphomicrobiales bacterium]